MHPIRRPHYRKNAGPAQNVRTMTALLLKRLTALNTLLIIGVFAAMADAQDRGRGAAPAGGPAPAAGQPPAGRGRAAGPGYLKLFDSNLPFDPHDLAGIWTPNGNGFGGGGRCRDCGDRGYSSSSPHSRPRGRRPSTRTFRRTAA